MQFIILMIVMLISSVISGQESREPDNAFVIGVLVNSSNRQEVVFGATLAVREINRHGGIDGRKVELNVKTVEGPWGKGSEAIVDLVFKDRAVAIMSSLEGKNTHMAEQVIAKTQQVFISSWASESSLSKAFVPWYFSLVPTDDQQADAFLKELYDKQNLEKWVIVYEAGFDGTKACQSLLNAAESSNLMIHTFEYGASDSVSEIIRKVGAERPEALIFLGTHLPVTEVLGKLKEMQISITVAVNHLAMASPDFIDFNSGGKNQIRVFGSVPWPGSYSGGYLEAFQNEFHHKPGIVGAYSYDGVMILAKALGRSIRQGIPLQNAMSEIQYQGLTGDIEFDPSGRLKSNPELLPIGEGNGGAEVK
jgi:branched-chain amino acid transport system substrate-binding protein